MQYLDDIESAIQTVKANNTVLLIFIHDDSDNSKTIDAILQDEEIANECSNFIGLRLESKSEAAAQFSAIYPVMAVPTIYLVGPSGTPLEVQLGAPEGIQAEFLGRVKKAKGLLHTADSSSNAAPGANAVPAQSEAAASPLSERLQVAQELLQKKREAQADEEKEKAKQQEMERRNVGRSVQHLREQQREKEMKERAADMRKEKAEAAAARQRVKAQIEADKAERARRLQQERGEQLAAEKQQRVEKEEKVEAAKTQAAEAEKSRVRMQFRLVNAQPLTNTFDVSTSLGDVAEWVAQQIGHGVSNFQMAQIYPRRVFTTDDMQLSLRDLDLVSSVAINVTVGASPRSTSRQVQSTGDGGILAMILAPFLFIWAFITGLFGGRGAAATSTSTATATTSSGGRPTPQGGAIRRQGNMARLRNSQDDPDPNATWNGNSTQQM